MIENRTYLTDYLQITVNGENMSEEVIESILQTIELSLQDTNIAKNIDVELENDGFLDGDLDFNELLRITN